MIEWLLSSIDSARGHEVGVALSWHARTMTLAWGVIAPAAVVITRYMKIMPNQNWPEQLDNKFWWRSHLYGHIFAVILTFIGMGLIWRGGHGQASALHSYLGYALVLFAVFQAALGFGRGSKGGPMDPAADGSLRGDHYDMTRRRLHFERVHKIAGYLVLVLGAVSILSGMWAANAPIWMWLCISGYWAILIAVSFVLQRRGCAYDTYQAIWGPDPQLPGNKMVKMGYGTVRPSECPRLSKKG